MRGAPMVNALPGGQVLAEFRGIRRPTATGW